MNVLLLSSRFPWPPFSGDRLRATIWLSALAPHANVALVAPDGRVPADAPYVRFHAAARSASRAFAAALRVAAGAPVHALLAAPYDWADAIARARADAGPFDATIVLLSRLDPWVRALLPEGTRVLDAIDSLRRSMFERAREAAPPLRPFWRAESRRVARAEADAARAYDRVLVVSDDESPELNATVISNGVPIAPLDEHAPRAFDFGFWGRLAYFANADAASWLLNEVWPRIRAARPQATLVIAGADAPRTLRAHDGRDGVTLRSPVDDMPALARSIRIALFPVRYGSGQSTKALEAAEAGCAIAATPQALRGLAPLAAHAFLADDAEGLARVAMAALDDEAARITAARALRAAVSAHYARDTTLARLAALIVPHATAEPRP
ncbi:MAG: glycosyltransferase [Acidobacteria bacterium]|nr:glycosyltransferase [Acidobacteriota bacterium]MBV9478114.1 glycosyltransferase [Acidobacteriota bacterium]